MLKSLISRVGLAAVTSISLISCGDKEGSSTTATENPQSSGDVSSEAVLVISAIPDEKITDQKPKFDKVAAYLSSKLGVKAEFQFSKDYSDAIQKFKNGEAHLVWFGGLSGVQARMAVPGAEAIAQGVEDPKYKSYFIAHKDVAIEPGDEFPEAIKDLNFTFGSTGSTSGRLMPSYFILKNTGKLPGDWLTKGENFQASGGHVATANSVADGTFQVGALSYKAYDKEVATNEKVKNNTKIIWTTPFYADYNFTIHPDAKTAFGDNFFAKAQDALVAAQEGDGVLEAINRSGIIPARNEEFDGIKAVAVKVGLIEE